MLDSLHPFTISDALHHFSLYRLELLWQLLHTEIWLPILSAELPSGAGSYTFTTSSTNKKTNPLEPSQNTVAFHTAGALHGDVGQIMPQVRGIQIVRPVIHKLESIHTIDLALISDKG